MLKSPNQLNEEQEQQYKAAWMDSLYTLLNATKGIIFLILLVLIYLPFKKDIKTWRQAKPVITKTQVAPVEEDLDKIENGIHLQTGLIYAPGFELVNANCTVCHSAKLVTQNRATREGWDQMIVWMQEKQGLWDLGDKKPAILDYLSKHYAPVKKGRRSNLEIAEIEWYILDLESSSE